MARYTNDQLIQVIQKAARRINRELCLTSTSEEITVSASGEISPSNSDLEDLVLLQAECMIINIDVNNDFTATGNGYFAKDGEQSLDTRTDSSLRVRYLDSSHNPCKELEKALLTEKLRRCGDPTLIW